MFHQLFAQASTNTQDNPVLNALTLVFAVFVIIGLWKMFTKAGRPGWAAIIPFYNTYTTLKVGSKPGWWLILLIIPIVNIYFSVVLGIAIAKRFDRSTFFGAVICGLFGSVGYAIIGYSGDTYNPAEEEQEDA